MGIELFKPVILFSATLDDEDLVNRLNGEEVFDINTLFSIVGELMVDILYSTFFEYPGDNLFGSLNFEDNEIIYNCFLEEEFYNKHIGKFIDEAARKIINQIIISFVARMEEIDWNTV